MSGTTTPPPPPPEPPWAKPAVGTYALAAFVGGLVVAWVTKDERALDICIGASISMAKDVISYYFGSSAGSDRKTELLNAPPKGPTP